MKTTEQCIKIHRRNIEALNDELLTLKDVKFDPVKFEFVDVENNS